jgi:hypothetical protein
MTLFSCSSQNELGQLQQDRKCTDNVTLEARPCNYCCSGKAICNSYSECVFVSSRIQDAMNMRHIVIYGLLGSKLFFHSVTSEEFSRGKKLTIKRVF